MLPVLMKTTGTVAACLILALSQPLLANGGGYFRGGVENAGDIAGFEPVATGNIRILDEKLSIKLGKKEADVEVRYLMRNITDKKVKIRFGFPVEETFDMELMVSEDEQKFPDGKKLAYCKNYQISAGGKAVKSTWNGEPSKIGKFKGVAGWLVSELTFAAGEEKPVLIRFQSEYPVEQWGVSDDESRNAAIFRYRLSTAACWADTIGNGKITVEANGIDPSEIRVLKPVNRFKKEGNRWVWNFENLEPAMADDIEIEAQPGYYIYGGRHADTFGGGDVPAHRYEDYMERGKRWSIIHANYEVKASSTLPPEDGKEYPATNIRTRYEETAWSEGAKGSGVGEWLEITPAAPKRLLEILLKGGFQKDGLFKKNARPKRVVFKLNGEHEIQATLPDKEEEIVIPVTGYDKPVKKIRMTVLEVYEGSAFEDLCITSLRLHALLDKKPKISHAR